MRGNLARSTIGSISACSVTRATSVAGTRKSSGTAIPATEPCRAVIGVVNDSTNEQLPIPFLDVACPIVLGKPCLLSRLRGLGQPQRLGSIGLLGVHPEMEVIEQPQCFDCVCDCDLAILDADQAVAVVFLAAESHVRRPGEHGRTLTVEVGH